MIGGVLLAVACGRPVPAPDLASWEPTEPRIAELGFGPSDRVTGLDAEGDTVAVRRGGRFQLWTRGAAGRMSLAQELHGELGVVAAGHGVGWVAREGKLLQVTPWGARPVADVPDMPMVAPALAAAGGVAAYTLDGSTVLFLPAVEPAVAPAYAAYGLRYPDVAGPEPVWRPTDPTGPLLRQLRDADAARVGSDLVLALAFGEGSVDLWSLEERQFRTRLFVEPGVYRALGEVAVGPRAVAGVVFSPAVALVEWPSVGGAAVETPLPASLAAALAGQRQSSSGGARGLVWTPGGLVVWAGAEVWRRGGSGAWARLADLPEGGVVGRDGEPAALAADGSLRFGAQRIPGRAPLSWLAAGDGRWCVASEIDVRCFEGVGGSGRTYEAATFAGDLADGHLHLLRRDGAWLRPDEDVPARPVDPDGRTIAVAPGTGIAAIGTLHGTVWMVEAEEAEELEVGSGSVDSLAWTSDGRMLAVGTFYGALGLVDTVAKSWRSLPEVEGHLLDLAWEHGLLAVAVDGPARRIDPAEAGTAYVALPWRATRLDVGDAGEVVRTNRDLRALVDPGAAPLPAWLRARDVAWVAPGIVAWMGDEDAGVVDLRESCVRVVARGEAWRDLDPSCVPWKAGE